MSTRICSIGLFQPFLERTQETNILSQHRHAFAKHMHFGSNCPCTDCFPGHKATVVGVCQLGRSMSLAATPPVIHAWLLCSDAVHLLASSKEISEIPGLREKCTWEEFVFERRFKEKWPRYIMCHYRHSWSPHSGYKRRIQLQRRRKPHCRYVCDTCIEWLQKIGVKFEFLPCAVERNQIC